MLVDKLQANMDKETDVAQTVLENTLIALKKRSIPRRIKALMQILDKCDVVIEDYGLTTAGSLISYFTDEMQALREANTKYHYQNDCLILREACKLYRVKKYSNCKN